MEFVLNRPGPFAEAEFEPETAGQLLASVKLLIIGAGGLGCEILKNLALIGFQDIHVIDMDTIDVSNLNRQFLFRHSDVGESKANVAARFITDRISHVRITPHFCKIQDYAEDFYRQFSLIICGLDSVDARRWINALVFKMFDPEDPSTTIPIIDGGTEGFKGQSRVIIPGQTSCYECSLDMLTKRQTFPICTIANTPRLPEHCIEWASVLEWPKVWGEVKLDGDDPEHIQWVLKTALARANEFNITGITLSLAQGVVKNIIPAIAATNAIIAASCCHEAFKMVTGTAPVLKNYMMYTGDDGVYTYTFEHQQRPDCPVCGAQSLKIKVSPETTLQEFMDMLLDMREVQLKTPSLRTATRTLYMQAPAQLELATRGNLEKPMSALIEDGEEISVTDKNLPFSVGIIVSFN